MFVIHSFVTLVGFLFVKSEIQGLGNEKLLNNFQEGLIIAQKDSGKLLFANKKAESLNKYLHEELSTEENKQHFSVFERSEKQFAQINPSMLKDCKLDSEQILDGLDSLKEYISFEQVIFS